MLIGEVVITSQNGHYYITQLNGHSRKWQMDRATELGLFCGYTCWTKSLLDYSNEQDEFGTHTNSRAYWKKHLPEDQCRIRCKESRAQIVLKLKRRLKGITPFCCLNQVRP